MAASSASLRSRDDRRRRNRRGSHVLGGSVQVTASPASHHEVRGAFLCHRDPARPLRWATLGHRNARQSQETCASTCGYAYQRKDARTLSESVLAQYRRICKTAGQRPFPQVKCLFRISTERLRKTCKDLKRPTLWATLGHSHHASLLTLISDTLPSSLDGLATANAASNAIDALASSSPAGCR